MLFRRLSIVVAFFCAIPRCAAGDFSLVPLIDGERTGLLGVDQFLNNWGGPYSKGNLPAVVRDATVSRSGGASIRADLGTIDPGGFGFFQTFSSEPASQSLRQTRDLTRYAEFETFIRNDANAPFNLKLELKDYRDSGAHLAHRTFSIPASTGWTRIAGNFDLASPAWTVVGSPDLSRTYAAAFVATPQAGTLTGSFYLDDFNLREPGGPIDVQTAPMSTLVERLAERQFNGLWAARNRQTGLIYNTSDDANLAALNTTAGVLWMLPAAVRRGWVMQAEADAFASQVAASLNFNMEQSRFVPTRFLNPAAAALPGGRNEESSVDASFMALALHQYKRQPWASPALAGVLDATQNRFELDEFATPNGFRLAYFSDTGMTNGVYDGYTNEGKVVSLAAELSTMHHVPLESRWNSDALRSRVFLTDPDQAHLTHSLPQFRAPFGQALLNLFVDVSDRGVDNFPNRALATNPWQNFLRYEGEVAEKLDELGREHFFQPDAGKGGSTGYQQYNLYVNDGQFDPFMPWSAALALLAGAEGADDALRFLLDQPELVGPLGLADSARWTAGAESPSHVPMVQDNWNMALSTMALLEILEGDAGSNDFFAQLDEVRTALDNVFVEGDVNGNGVADGADLALWRSGFGVAAGATPASGDVDGDAAVDGSDFLRWQRGPAPVAASRTGGAVPEPGVCLVLAGLMPLFPLRPRPRRAAPSWETHRSFAD